MNLKMFFLAIVKMLFGVLMVGALIFLPAGTFSYPNGWILMGILFIPMLFAGIVMMIKSPKLLEKRLRSKESRREQRTVIIGSTLMFVAGFSLAGFGIRFGWYQLPFVGSLVAAGFFLAAYLLYAIVLYENPYLSRVIEVFDNHRVIDTGLYSVVRHPMYSATLVLFMAMPFILGSLYSLIIFLIYPVLIVKRISHEESFLKKELPGYAEYCKRVKYRLIPFVW